MGLSDTIADAVVTAIDAVGDIAKLIIYTEVRESVYDPSNGEVISTKTNHSIKVIVSTPKNEKYKSGIASGNKLPKVYKTTSDLEIMFASKSLPVVPKSNDTVTLDGKTYQIVDIDTDPAGASFTLIISKL